MRCFVAIELPEVVRARLGALQEQLAGLGRSVRWVKPQQIHLTLKFLGEIAEAQVPRICMAMREVAARFPTFEFEVRGTGCFPPRGLARVVWAGIPELSATLTEVHRACEDACAALGFAPENRPFAPHLTLGRVNDAGASNRVHETLREMGGFIGGVCPVSELIVFQSELTPRGPISTALARARLGAPE